MGSAVQFGTSGLRGLAEDLLGAETPRHVLAFIAHLRETHQLGGAEVLLVGQDLRESSPAIAGSVVAAVQAAGLRALDCGRVATPALALAALAQAVPAIMVTGSHIPADRNGLKFYTPSGEITKADEAGIVESLEFVGHLPAGGAEGEPAPGVRDAYLARCRMFLREDALSGRRIGVWQHSSVFRDDLVALLAGFGAECIPLGPESVFKAVDTEAVEAADAAQIAAWVAEHRLDALVSTDGDADRPLVADDTGALVRGDVLGILAARFLSISSVVTPVTSTSAVETSGFFTTAIRTRVGSPYVLAGMERARLGGGKVLGFEANGGVLLGTPVKLNFREIEALPTRDAMLPILAALGLAQQTGRPLSRLVATLPPRFSRSGRLEHVPAVRSAALLEVLSPDFFAPQGEVAARSDVDGVRVVLASGDVIHYRPSGNAPELRCYTEAGTPDRAEAMLAWGLDAAAAVVRD